MTLATYLHRDSPVHRSPPGAKMLALVLAGTGLLLVHDLGVALAALAGTLALYGLARVPLAVLLRQARPAFWIVLVVFLFQLYARDLAFAAATSLRFLALLLLASLVTLTTPASAMIETLTRSLSWLRWLGLHPAKVSLGLSLALRFIPVVAAIAGEVREAQKARGLDGSVLALAVPVMIRTLKMADEIAEAIDARGYDPT